MAAGSFIVWDTNMAYVEGANGVPYSQLTTNFIANYQLTTVFLAKYQLTANPDGTLYVMSC